MPRLSIVVLSAVLGVCLAMPAAAQWKWRGKDGRIQYSDLPPPAGTAEQDILARPNPNQRRIVPAAPASAPASAASAAPVAKVEPELEAKRRKAEQEKADKDKAEQEKLAAIKADNCGKAKAYLRTLEDGIRVSRTDAKGEREVLDDKGRAEDTKRAKDVIARDCK
jgi:hypothetical protein